VGISLRVFLPIAAPFTAKRATGKCLKIRVQSKASGRRCSFRHSTGAPRLGSVPNFEQKRLVSLKSSWW